MQKVAFAPGFRLSPLDIVVLVIGTTATISLGLFIWWWGFVVGFVIAHFFLFCNIVRMARPLELVWAGIFVALATATVATDAPGWPAAISISLAATAALVVIEMRKPSYHGVAWQRINPRLPDWWESRNGE